MTTANTSNTTMSRDINQLKKRVAKSSLNVKFDLDGTGYKAIENIGIGAYGVVCSAVHEKSQTKVAIKKIPHVLDASIVTKRTFREIKILKHFKHDNIISIQEILKPKERRFTEIYVVFDLMESDLHRIIYTDQELTEEHIRYFLYQILRGLKYIHSANVIHRDMKPSNLLVNEDCHVRIGDFGMARGISQTPDEPCYYMTQYVATRWYRAPEILLALVEYGTAVDMWSVGCIFAEMLGRKHLFPGKNYLSQIKLIIGILGSPPEAVLQQCYNDLIKRIVKDIGRKQPVLWKVLFPKASKKAIDLLSKILVIDPKERFTVEMALQHPYLNKYHDPDDEPICVPTFNFEFEKEDLSKEQFQEAIYKEIMEFHEPKTPTLSFNAVLRPAPKSEQQPLSEQIKHESLESDEKPQLTIVNVDTVLVPPHVTDIEMLSAKSNDGSMEILSMLKSEKLEELQQKLQQQQQQDQKKMPPPQGDNKTISDGTKELIKKALLNASQRRQRTESCGDDAEGKQRITAIQRQKEREEKRRRKKERANERMKKQKEKQASDSLLSNEDKELLRRWACMQTKTKIAPAPEPGQANSTSTHTVSVSLVGNSLTITPIPQSQVILQHPVQVPAGSQSLQLQSQQQQQQQQQQQGCVGAGVGTGTPQSTRVSEAKSDLLVGSGSQTPASHLGTGVRQTRSPPSHDIRQSVSPVSQVLQQGTKELSNSDVPQVVQDNGQLQTTLGQMPHRPYLHGADTSSSCLYQSSGQPLPAGVSMPSVSGQSSVGVEQFINTSPPPLRPDLQQQTQYSSQNQTSQDQYTHQIMSTLDSNIPEAGEPAENTFSTISLDGLDFFSSMVPTERSPPPPIQPCFQFQPYPDQLPSESPPKRHSLEGGYQPSQTYPAGGSVDVHTGTAAASQIEGNSSPEHPASVVGGGGHPYSTQFIPFSQYSPEQATGATPSFTGAPVSHYSPENIHPETTAGPDQTQPASSRPTPLKISVNSPPRPAPGTDMIAMLSKQFSKSQVEDIFPPLLSLTPKGTGGGYGVGADLDALMLDTQEHIESIRAEQSPLSSSLLADWLDVRGNISLADLEELEHVMDLHSPMAVSYSDVSLQQ